MNISFRHHGRTLRGELVFPRRGKAPFPAVLLVHGRGSNRNAMVGILSLERKIVAAGAAVMRIDLSGHGESDGKFADVTVTKAGQDVAAAVIFLQQQRRINPLSIAAVGHSMGGTAILLARAAGARLKAFVLLAPVGDTKYHAQHRLPPSVIREWKATGWYHWNSSVTGKLRSLRYSFHRDLLKLDTLKLTHGNHQPVLIVHGDQDRSVPLLESQRLMRVLDEPKKLVVMRGADHNFRRPHDTRQMVETVVTWLKQFHIGRISQSVVVVVQYQDRMLAVKRSNQVWYYRNNWGIVGGHLPPGADPVKHAFVELREELGLRRSEVELIRVGRKVRLHDERFNKTWVSATVLVRLKRMKKIRIDWEHTAYKWIKPSDFPFHQSYPGIEKQFAALGLR